MLEIVVTGAARSGTGYMAQLLSSAGLECGHEAVFDCGGVHQPRNGLLADSSWMAAPWLPKLTTARIVHLVRHPVKVVESLLSVGSLHTRPWCDFMRRYVPLMREFHTEADQAACYWLEWNAMIEAYAGYRHRVEDKPGRLWKFLGAKPNGPLFDDTTYNHRPEYAPVKLDMTRLDAGLRAGLVHTAKRYGYKL